MVNTYNTRRKSLSLPSLGIQLPNHTRTHPHRPNSKSTTPPMDATQPPTKRVKRSHQGVDLPSPSPASSPSPRRSPEARPPRRALEHTPPPSPKSKTATAVPILRKVDTEGINDDIVIAVIEQLEKTGNRPHLIRELATVLATTNRNLAHSANPAALLSSRLAVYFKRPWTALSPCPIAKELIPVHPRKVFFYLTTQPRGQLPQNSDDIITPQIKKDRLTPSISDPSVKDDSDGSDGDGDHDDGVDADRKRLRLSPSPEIELRSPELELDDLDLGLSHDSPMSPTPGESFSARTSLGPDSGSDHHHHRLRHAPSPRLEADERGFTETATAVRQRGASLHQPAVPSIVEGRSDHPDGSISTNNGSNNNNSNSSSGNHNPVGNPSHNQADNTELSQRRDQELLFGSSHAQVGTMLAEPKSHLHFGSSPMIPPKAEPRATTAAGGLGGFQLEPLRIDDVEMGIASWSLMSPESIEVDELECMFENY